MTIRIYLVDGMFEYPEAREVEFLFGGAVLSFIDKFGMKHTTNALYDVRENSSSSS
jgi:acyl-CoA hydrolase